MLSALLLFSACEEAGTDDGGGGGGGQTITGTGSGSATLPGDVTETFSANALALAYFGNFYDTVSTSAFNTDILIFDDSYPVVSEPSGTVEDLTLLYMEVIDGSDSLAIDAGTYNINETEAIGTVYSVELIVNVTVDFSGDFPVYIGGYQASTYGGDDTITGGTVTISETGGEYTIDYTFNLLDGGTITGTYTGAVDYEEDYSSF
jgi:hypothetical protein